LRLKFSEITKQREARGSELLGCEFRNVPFVTESGGRPNASCRSFGKFEFGVASFVRVPEGAAGPSEPRQNIHSSRLRAKYRNVSAFMGALIDI
jgi:hypothetical protein